MSIWVKLCGLTTEDAVQTAIDCQVQAVGFVFARSPRAIEPVRARVLAAALPESVASVAVMLRPTQDDVEAVFDEFEPDYLQADWQAMAQITLPAGVRPLPVYRQGDGVAPDALPPLCVFEGMHSGHGETVDWQAAAPYAADRRLVLAGGLHPDNVTEALSVLRPFGVDVSSGIERERGVKDPSRMSAFVARVRAFEARQSYLPETTLTQEENGL